MNRIDFNKIRTKEAFHKTIKEILNLPDYYGNNLDALYDVLGEISHPIELEFIKPSQENEEISKLISGMKRLSEDIAHENSNIKIKWVDQKETNAPIKGASDGLGGNTMEFRDLKSQYRVLKDDIDRGISEVLSDCNFISGGQVKELEQELASFTGSKHCITCANGTDALSIAMMAWGIGQGDGVFVPDFTFFASGEIVSQVGATPIFVDVDERTFNLSPDALEKAISEARNNTDLNLKACVAVDLFGLPADLNRIRDICHENGLLLLEDGAQGFGGHIGKEAIFKRACSFGDISTTSFFPAKPLGCYGDGGAIFTDNDEWADLIRSICVHGKGEMKYDNVRIGVNSRLDTIQAAILKVKLKAFSDYELDAVNKAAGLYDQAFKDTFKEGNREKEYLTSKGNIKLPLIPKGFFSSYAQYTLIVSDEDVRDELKAALNNEGVPTMIYYPKPMQKQLAFNIKYGEGYPCPVTENLCKTVLSLPMHPYLSEEDVTKVVFAVGKYMGNI